jgi:hypothetical protein
VDVDLVRRRVRIGSREVRLTGLEAQLLAYLAARLDTDVSRSELLDQVWGYASTSSSRAVDFVVSRLRAKLGVDGPLHLLTRHGVGYRLSLAPALGEGARLPSGVVDRERGWFVPDGGEPIELGPAELAMLLRIALHSK